MRTRRQRIRAVAVALLAASAGVPLLAVASTPAAAAPADAYKLSKLEYFPEKPCSDTAVKWFAHDGRGLRVWADAPDDGDGQSRKLRIRVWQSNLDQPVFEKLEDRQHVNVAPGWNFTPGIPREALKEGEVYSIAARVEGQGSVSEWTAPCRIGVDHARPPIPEAAIVTSPQGHLSVKFTVPPGHEVEGICYIINGTWSVSEQGTLCDNYWAPLKGGTTVTVPTNSLWGHNRLEYAAVDRAGNSASAHPLMFQGNSWQEPTPTPTATPTGATSGGATPTSTATPTLPSATAAPSEPPKPAGTPTLIGGRAQPPASDGPELAETGGTSAVPLIGGLAGTLLVVGTVAFVVVRRRKADEAAAP